MKKAGCDTLSFGLQSAHPVILKGINRSPREPEALKETLTVANKVGLVTAVSYIFGLPMDTEGTIQCTIDYSLSSGATLANYFNLVILRGSQLEQMYGNSPVNALSEPEVVALVSKAYRAFYTDPICVARILWHIAHNPQWVIEIIPKIPTLLAWIGFRKVKR